MLKLFAGTALLVVATFSQMESACAADPTPQEWAALLAQSMQAATHPLAIANGTLSGPGADLIHARAAQSRFALFGEDHGSQSMADVETATMRSIADLGYRTAAIELGPWETQKLEGLLKSGNMDLLAGFLRKPGYNQTFAMYGWQGDIAFVQGAMQLHGKLPGPAVWGLDQEFIGAAQAMFDDIATAAAEPGARALAADLAKRSAADQLDFLGKVDPKDLQALKAALTAPADARLRDLVDRMIISARIYVPFVVGPGSAFTANLERENFMKTTFLAQFRNATAANHGERPHVIFKFGDNHLFHGLSPTYVPSLGNFAGEFALTNGDSAFNVDFICGPGGNIADIEGNAQSCDEGWNKALPDFTAYIDPHGITLFDLTVLREHPRRWEKFTQDEKDEIWGYDMMVVIGDGKPAKML